MKKQNNSIFIIATGILIAISRLMLGNIENSLQKDQAVLIVMALVNYIALAFVLLFICKDLNDYCDEKINKAGISTDQKKNRKRTSLILSAIYLCVYLIVGMLYIIYFKSSDLNDAISIIALAFSIATNGLIDDFSPSYYKFIVKLSSIFTKKVKG
ncbi:hypothetical protein AALA79_02000 [Lachnospiraceae bacterium 64-25]